MRAKKWLLALFVSTWALAQTGQLQPDADGVYPTDLNGIKSARLIDAVPASIPEDPRLNGLKHVCALWVTIGRDGTPKTIEVLNKIKTPFDDAAIAAVRQSHFRAGSYRGTAVATRLLLCVPFFFGSRQPFLPEEGVWDRWRNMTPPIAFFTPEAELTDEARAK